MMKGTVGIQTNFLNNYVLAKLYSNLENNNIRSVLYITIGKLKRILNRNIKNKTQTRAPVCFCSAAQTQHRSVPNTELMTFLGRRAAGPCLKGGEIYELTAPAQGHAQYRGNHPCQAKQLDPGLWQEGAESHTFKSIQVVQITPGHLPASSSPRLMPDPACKYLASPPQTPMPQ